MRMKIAAALAALASAEPSLAQVATIPDLSTATPVSGSWGWAATPDGSEAVFVGSTGLPQLWLHCARASRAVTIARPASGAVAFLSIWTSSATRDVPASYNPATGRTSIQLSAYDGLLDALAFSRGRIGVAVRGMPPLVAPTWPEIARVVEDCRA